MGLTGSRELHRKIMTMDSFAQDLQAAGKRWDPAGGMKDSLYLNGWHSVAVPPSSGDTQNGVRLLRRNQYFLGRLAAGQQEAMMGCKSL